MQDKQGQQDNLIKFKISSSLNDTSKLIGVLEEQLKKEEAFGVVLIREGEEKSAPEARKLFNNWLKANKSLLKRYCYGLAMVAASESMQRIYKPVAKLMISKTYGCPGELFAKEEDGVEWLLKQKNIWGK